MIFLILFAVLLLGYIVAAVFPAFFERKGFTKSLNADCVIVGHRGGADLGEENTLDCIEKGIRTGADYIEIDIHLTKDNRLVVCHDQSINRTTDGEGLIRDMTLQEIRRYHIVDSNGNSTEQQIPLLEEVIKLAKGRVKLLIEIKKTNDIYVGIEKLLMDMINRYGIKDQVIVQSFNDSVVEKIHQLDKDIRIEKLVIFKLPLLPIIFDGTFSVFTREKYDYISSFNFYHNAMSGSLLRTIHGWNKEVKIWTIITPEETPALPFDGIITNRPDLF